MVVRFIFLHHLMEGHALILPTSPPKTSVNITEDDYCETKLFWLPVLCALTLFISDFVRQELNAAESGLTVRKGPHLGHPQPLGPVLESPGGVWRRQKQFLEQRE